MLLRHQGTTTTWHVARSRRLAFPSSALTGELHLEGWKTGSEGIWLQLNGNWTSGTGVWVSVRGD